MALKDKNSSYTFKWVKKKKKKKKSQTEKDKYYTILLIPPQKAKTILFPRQRLTDIENKLKVTHGERRMEEREIKRLGLIYVHHTYKIENQQGPTVEHRECDSRVCENLYGKRIWSRMYKTESPCWTSETNTVLYLHYNLNVQNFHLSQ